MSKPRKHLTAEEKVSILRRHFIEKIPISLVCEQASIQPSQFYQWQKLFFENGAAAFQPSSRARHDQNQDRITALEAKLRKKDEVLGELMEEHVALKKSLGEL
jgi:transposase